VKNWWDTRASVASLAQKAHVHPTIFETIPRDQFQIDRKDLIFQCANLKHYIDLEIAGFDRERLRCCRRNGCNKRFLARDLRERYCSDLCSAIERNRAKLRYWDKHKKKLLAVRKEKRSTRTVKRRKT